MIQWPAKPNAGDPVKAFDAAQMIDGVRELERLDLRYGRRPRRNLDDAEAGNRFPNRIRALDAAADKQWALDNGGTVGGTDPLSLFLAAVQDAIDDEYTGQCFVVAPNRMLAEIADASQAKDDDKNSGVWLIPAPELVTVPQAYFGDWFYIGRKFEFDASENDFEADPPVLAHPLETIVNSSDEDFDLDALESYTPATLNNNSGTASITYIDSGWRTAILGRVMLPSNDGEHITGSTVIEQNISGVCKLAWNIAPKLLSLYSEMGGLNVDFQIIPSLLIGDGLDAIAHAANAAERWSVFAPNHQLYGRPEALTVLTSASGVRIAPPAIGGFNGVGTSEDYLWLLDETGLEMWASEQKTVELTRASPALELTDWSTPTTRVRLDAYGNYVRGQEDVNEAFVDLWKLSADGLVLKDADDNTRVNLLPNSNDEARLDLYNADGSQFLKLSTHNGGDINSYDETTGAYFWITNQAIELIGGTGQGDVFITPPGENLAAVWTTIQIPTNAEHTTFSSFTLLGWPN